MDTQALESLSNDITRSNVTTVDSQQQTQIFMRCMQLLLLDQFENENHIFCDPKLKVISGHTLIMFSFPGATSTPRQIIESRFEKCLFSCLNCVRNFYIRLSEIRSRFVLVRKIAVSQVIQFLDIVNNWIYTRIEKGFNLIGNNLLHSADMRVLLCNCMSNVLLLRSKADLRTKTNSLYKKLKREDVMKDNNLIPSTIYYLVEGDENERMIASEMIPLEKSTLDPHVVDEICYQFYRLQDSAYFNPSFSERFWRMISKLLYICEKDQLSKILKPADMDAMGSYTNIKFYPLIRVLFNNLMANLDSPLPTLLRVLSQFLEVYKGNFWQIAEECHFSFIVETVPLNPYLPKYIAKSELGETDLFNDLFGWVQPFVNSLSGSQKQIAVVKLANAFFSIKGTNDFEISRISVTLLLSCIDMPLDETSPDSVTLLKMRDIRIAVEKNAQSVIKLACENGVAAASKLVSSCLAYDIAVAGHNSTLIEKGEIPSLSETNSILWEGIKLCQVSSGSNLLFESLKSFRGASQIIIFNEKKNVKISQELEAAIKIHKRDCNLLNNNINGILEKICLLDPNRIKSFFTTGQGLQSIWSCIFSRETSSSAISLVSQLQDTEGRYEAITFLLNFSLRASMSSLCNCVDKISYLKYFEPCPKTLRILMDVIRALTDPLTGILNTEGQSHTQSKNEIERFWRSSWSLLVMIYKQTLTWANYYHLSDLIEFTRDTLDTSHLLLDSFRVLLDFFSDDRLVGPLFEPFMTTFTHVIVWLRLGDLSLLKLCVDLVFKGFDLAKELNVNVDKEFIRTFAKYGAKAKKFNNKLSEEQRDMILAKASEFDPVLVSQVVEDAAREKSASRSTTPITSKLTQIETAKSNLQHKPKELKQINLSRFGIVTTKPPVAPAPQPGYKPNNLEAIRNELKSSRSTIKAPAAAPAAARPAGFNNKAPVVGRSLNALKAKKLESESSEDEDDVDTSDLFYDSKKKSKITELDFNGKPVTKLATAKKIENERKEEERMRLRLNVNLKPLYSTILRWNYNSNSEYPTEDRDCYRVKANEYASARDYTNEIEPLLMLECWQGIQSSRTTGQELGFELLIGSRTTCDGFFDVYASVKKSVLAQHKLSETDLIVLGYVADQGLTDPHDIAAHLKLVNSQTCLGKVREIKFANPDFCDVTIRVYPQGLMMGLLTPKSVVVAMKVMPMVTLEREYSSLKGLQYYDLCDDILAAKPAPIVTISKSVAQNMCKKLGVNESQAAAIIGSSQSEGFSLIQGPPGTGKTKTILGIVGHFISKTEKNNVITVPTPNGNGNGPGTQSDAKPVAKVLICAPSNAAVDELVLRLKDGVIRENGERYIPKIVRLGRSDAMNAAVRDTSLEELVDRHLRDRAENVSIDPNIRQEHTKCLAERDRIRQQLKGDLKSEEILKLEDTLKEVNKKRSELGRLLDEQREKASVAYRSREIERRRIQAKLISEAQVICSTLSGSAHDFLASMYIKFDQVIVDEACQCVELSAIIPLRYGCKKCVMVGDPNQLPPTVLSQKAASLKYEESLFVRMQRNNPNLVYLLDVQYRMHPEISQFPSLEFYNSRLTDGEGMLEKNTRPWHANNLLSPYRFFDILSRHQQNDRSKSFLNQTESKVAVELVEKLMEVLPGKLFKGKVGIISPYKEQIRNLRNEFTRKFGASILTEVDFNTVDGFQGQEKEIIIMSCVRASETGSVGFLSDIRRMNVALTRARTTLWVLGNKNSLARDKVWRKLITNAESRNCVSSAAPGFTRNIHLQKHEMQWLSERTTDGYNPEIRDSEVPAEIIEVHEEDSGATNKGIDNRAVGSDSSISRNKKKKDHSDKNSSTTINESHNTSGAEVCSKNSKKPSDVFNKRPAEIEHKDTNRPKKKAFIYKLEPKKINEPKLEINGDSKSRSNNHEESLGSASELLLRLKPPQIKPRGNGPSIFIQKKRPTYRKN